MVKLLLNFLAFLVENCQLLTSVAVMAGIFILLAKSIKKHPGIYYFIFAIPAILFILRAITGDALIGSSRTSVIGLVMREYVHAAGFSFPLLVIVMYMGALPAHNPYVKRLMMIRKELSVISGFPILIHSWVRIGSISGSIAFFAGTSADMAQHGHTGFGAVLSNSAYLLGILMVILFTVLWVTSFDAIHRRLGAVKWKKIQRWSYVLYAMLFLHSILIHVGGLLGGGGHGRGGGNMALAHTVAITSVCLVFISYLILRLRKKKKG
ncbi:MAG: hypothetical protein LBT83_12055 [Tannerella sp.]|jgi:DMSO/TMAO reductase YedYZ heme-binding membrane subunit|nr:hypothetical protein [Tannerella sp.]